MLFLKPIRSCFNRYSNQITFFSLIVFSLAVLARRALSLSQTADEGVHRPQIQMFFDGNFGLHDSLTTIPGFHYVVYLLNTIFGLQGIWNFRLVNLIFLLGILPIVYLTLDRMDSRSKYLRTAQVIFFPFLLPYSFVLYTDVSSLFLLLLSLFFQISDKKKLAAFVALLSLFVRQTNIAWICFLLVWDFLSLGGGVFLKIRSAATIAFLWQHSIHILSFLLFIAFYYFNRGVALGDRGHHPEGIYFGNLYYFLFLFSLLFLPILTAKNWKEILSNKMGPFLLTIVFVVVFFYSFNVNHGYNRIPGFLRNDFFMFLENKYFFQCLYMSISFFGLLSLLYWEVDFAVKISVLALAVFFLLPCQLVEQRYGLPVFLSYMILRKDEDSRVEFATLLLFIVLSLVILQARESNWFLI